MPPEQLVAIFQMEPFNMAINDIAELSEEQIAALMVEADRRAERLKRSRGDWDGDDEPGESDDRDDSEPIPAGGRRTRTRRFDIKKILDRPIDTAQDAYNQTVDLLCGILARPLAEVHKQLLASGQGWTEEQLEECRLNRMGVSK